MLGPAKRQQQPPSARRKPERRIRATIRLKFFLLCVFSAFFIVLIGAGAIYVFRTAAGDAQATSRALQVVGTSIAAAVVFIMALGYFLASGIANAARSLTTAVERLADGDLTATAAIRNRDEIGELARAFERLRGTLRELVELLQRQVASLAEATAQISAGADRVAEGSSQQAGEVQAVARTTEEMARIIEEASFSARRAAEAAAASQKTAAAGAEILTQTARTIAQINQKMAALGKESEQIGEILHVVEDIADQTNLLALNAAIEAARVGEQGRGFAVVAEQIRKLAERSGTSSKEIARLAKDVREGATAAMGSARHGVELTKEINRFIREIGEAVKKSVAMAETIAENSDRGAAKGEEVVSAVQSIAAAAQEAAASTEETAAAATNLTRTAEELRQVVARFKLV